MVIAFLRTIILYLFIIVGIRLMGKRQVGELEPSELVLSLIIALVVAFFCTIGIGTETWLGFVGYMVVGLVLWGLMLVKWHRGGKDSTVWMRTPEGVREY